MSGAVRFGIVGCGMIAALHADAIAHLESATLVGVTDANAKAAEAFASARGVKAYADYDEMLKDENIDAVCICTPSFLHAKMSIEALQACKHVAVEKPMALDAESADEVIREVDRTGKKLTVI
jgi:predicted dehydrogenase